MNIYTKPQMSLDYIILKNGVTVKVGTCLKMGDGGLVLCTAKEKPEFISHTDATGEGKIIPVERITDETVLVGKLSTEAAEISVGQKLQLAENGIDISPAVGGALCVRSFDGTGAGAEVLCTVCNAE